MTCHYITIKALDLLFSLKRYLFIYINAFTLRICFDKCRKYYNNIIRQWFAFYPLVCISSSQHSSHFTSSPFAEASLKHAHNACKHPQPPANACKVETDARKHPQSENRRTQAPAKWKPMPTRWKPMPASWIPTPARKKPTNINSYFKICCCLVFNYKRTDTTPESDCNIHKTN